MKMLVRLVPMVLLLWSCSSGGGGRGGGTTDTTSTNTDTGSTTGSDIQETTGKDQRGYGCECSDNSGCTDMFCSSFSVCTSNLTVECQTEAQCGCNSVCVVEGDRRTCQIPCDTTTDCPGTLQCADLDDSWTTSDGNTVTRGCVQGSAQPTVTWTQDIQPLVQVACVGCHTGGGGFGGANFDSYANTQAVKPGCLTDTSTLAEIMAAKVSPNPPCGGRMPQGGPFLSDDQVKLFADWVAAGAPE